MIWKLIPTNIKNNIWEYTKCNLIPESGQDMIVLENFSNP